MKLLALMKLLGFVKEWMLVGWQLYGLSRKRYAVSQCKFPRWMQFVKIENRRLSGL